MAALAGNARARAAAPPSLALIYLPFSLANSFTGMYALAATLVWGRLLFGVPLHFVHPWLFAVSLPVTVAALGLMGLVLASTFILYRHANALSNLLEYPVWIACGLIFSTSLLPGWTRPISWASAVLGRARDPARRARRQRVAAARDGHAPRLACLVIGTLTFRALSTCARARATCR